MADRSIAVTQNHDESIRSALVKAFETWEEPYDIKPDGVFGSMAVVKCGDVTISSETLDVEFDIPFDDDMEPNEAEIRVYNLSDSTIRQLKKDAVITVEAGYKGDTGVIFRGYISTVKTAYNGADKETAITAIDDIAEHTVESIAYAEYTKASYILKDLIDRTGIPVAVFKIRRDHTYEDSQTVDGDLFENIRTYAEVCGISVYVSRGKIYARYIKEGDNLNFDLSAETGMIDYPTAYTEEVTAEDYTDIIDGYEVEMLLQHRMCAGAIVKLTSRIANGTFRVCSGQHTFSSSDAVTKVKMY
ncbi:MAG: phage protein [Oscillospiraceae bacterium]|jgi:hypothetical protein